MLSSDTDAAVPLTGALARVPGRSTSTDSETVAPAAVDLFWLPLGAGGSVVRWNGRVYERLSAAVGRRRPQDLYHAALIVTSGGTRHIIELTPVSDSEGSARGVVGQGPVGARALGRFRLFRYELRCWPDGELPDAAHAVASPQRLTDEETLVRTLLEQLHRFPTATWGRDEHHVGEMWNSNSVVSWLLASAGVPMPELPPEGRAPGWGSGLAVARLEPQTRTTMTTTPQPQALRRTERTLLWLEVVLAVGAFGGAVGLITGAVDLGAATAELPFGSTAFAGWALALVNCLLPTVVVLAAIRGAPWAGLGHHVVGLALIGWIIVQVALLGWPPHWMQITYFVYGVVILALAAVLRRQGLRPSPSDEPDVRVTA